MDEKDSSKVKDNQKSPALKRDKNTVDLLDDEANVKEVSADRVQNRGQKLTKVYKICLKRLSLSREKQSNLISDDEFHENPKNSDLPKTLNKINQRVKKEKEKSCNEGVFMYKVKGKEVFPECCNKDENIFKKIAHSE